MPENKRHHYVPRFYLKRFSKDGKSICLFNLKSRKKIESANLKNQCYKKYFYGKDRVFEYELSQIESTVANILKHIDQNELLPPPTSQEYIFLTLFLLIQHARTKYATEALDEMTDKLMKHILHPEAEENGINLEELKIGLNNVPQFSIATIAIIYPIILDLHYKFLINSTNVEFITSDNPVVLYNQFMSFRKYGSNTGLATKGLQIFFPIDPWKLILLYDSEVYKVGNDKEHTIEIINPKDIHQINKLQICSCLENIYFRDPDFNAEALYKSVLPYLRKSKITIDSYPQYEKDNPKSELLITSRVDVRTNLKLTFIKIKKSAKKWRNKFIKKKIQPAVVIRDEQRCEDVRQFADAVKKGVYKAGDFFEFIKNKYNT